MKLTRYGNTRSLRTTVRFTFKELFLRLAPNLAWSVTSPAALMETNSFEIHPTGSAPGLDIHSHGIQQRYKDF